MDNNLTLVLSQHDNEIIKRIKAFYTKKALGRVWEIQIDASIIGGFIIVDGDIVVDYSVLGQLDSIKLTLTQG